MDSEEMEEAYDRSRRSRRQVEREVMDSEELEEAYDLTLNLTISQIETLWERCTPLQKATAMQAVLHDVLVEQLRA